MSRIALEHLDDMPTVGVLEHVAQLTRLKAEHDVVELLGFPAGAASKPAEVAAVGLAGRVERKLRHQRAEVCPAL